MAAGSGSFPKKVTLKVYRMVADEEGRESTACAGERVGSRWGVQAGCEAAAWNALVMVGVFGFISMGSTRSISGGLGLSPALLFDDGGQSKDWTGGGKQWSKRDLGVDCSSWLVLAGRYLLAFGPSFSPSSTALELRLLLCLGSVASIVTGLGPSTHDLQHPDLLPEVLVQLLEAGGGTECGYKATALWG